MNTGKQKLLRQERIRRKQERATQRNIRRQAKLVTRKQATTEVKGNEVKD